MNYDHFQSAGSDTTNDSGIARLTLTVNFGLSLALISNFFPHERFISICNHQG